MNHAFSAMQRRMTLCSAMRCGSRRHPHARLFSRNLAAVCDPFLADAVFASGVAVVNMINIREPLRLDATTARLVAFCALKGGLYGITFPISVIAMLFGPVDDHLVPASVHCKHLHPSLHAKQ